MLCCTGVDHAQWPTEREETIHRDNTRLFYKMSDIMVKGTMQETRGDGVSPGKSLNYEARRRELARIAQENAVRHQASSWMDGCQLTW